MLKIRNLHATYDGVAALHGVDMDIASGSFVGLIGPNGAGKTTLAKAISGTVTSWADDLSFEGTDLGPLDGHERVDLGIVHVPQGRRVFPAMNVEENLLMGAYRRAARSAAAEQRDVVFDLFPVLSDIRRQTAGSLSGGQQQMLAVGRGLMARPRLLILDEPSQGLAPVIVEEIFDSLGRLRARGDIGLLLVEQNAQEAMDLCDAITVLESGEVRVHGSRDEMRGRQDIVDAYLGQA
jgi:branched-chain amino acid transport system ATP-binding protein